jgi:hypothetical protein
MGNVMSGKVNEFEEAGLEHAPAGLLSEYWSFLLHTKKWWLLPILFILMLFGVLLLFSGSAAAPFIYTLF